ncbi:WD domain, G-beta repeat protein [Rhizoctonia solani 123E]|uniref:WD domain, G-beta repeat protein n=1 Tax=Rhizoctonia solani 123E TaxID=1423351 RepID=A0A074RLX9_9AGAM|nr:WD domain, G-beta repeat protein [Rhizoctonia solani 123E]
MQEGPCEHYSYAYFHHSVPRCAPLATPFAIGLSLFNPGSIGTIHFTLLAMPQLVSHFSALPPNLQLGPQPIRSNYSTVAANRLAATGFTASPDDLISPLAVRVVTCLLFFRNRIISASDDHQIHVYSPTSGELLLRLEGHEGGVWALAVSPNSPSAPHATDSLVSGSTDRTVRIWDLSTGKCTHVFGGHTSTVRCLAIVKPMWIDVDGRKEKWPKRTLIVTGSRDHTLSVWKLPRHGDIDAWARMAKIWIQPRTMRSATHITLDRYPNTRTPFEHLPRAVGHLSLAVMTPLSGCGSPASANGRWTDTHKKCTVWYLTLNVTRPCPGPWMGPSAFGHLLRDKHFTRLLAILPLLVSSGYLPLHPALRQR